MSGLDERLIAGGVGYLAGDAARETRERCAVCDFPLATEAEARDKTAWVAGLCWARWTRWGHRGPAIDWRARALEAGAKLSEWSEKDGNSPGYNLQKAQTYGRIAANERRRAAAAEARVEALEGALRAADYRLGEVSNYLGPFDHALMFRALSETIAQVRAALSATPPKPAPRPDATEALRVAMEALTDAVELLSHADFRNGNEHAGVDEGDVLAGRWVQRIRAALELLRAHVEPTPLETAVLAHTEKEMS